jgi:hypothetical protein
MIYIEKDKLIDIVDKLAEIELTSKSNYFVEEKRVPRVTEIISAMIAEPGLMKWANNLGWKKISYNKFMKEAADKGTYSHLAIEKFLKKENIDITSFNIMNYRIRETVLNVLDGFKLWWNDLNKDHKVKVILQEETILCKYFGGTCDCVLKVDDQYWLIDFKTSNHMSYNYALQLSAYRYLLQTQKNINVSKCMVLRLNKDYPNYYIYEFDMENSQHLEFMENALETFMILSSAYRMRLSNTEEYNKIFS